MGKYNLTVQDIVNYFKSFPSSLLGLVIFLAVPIGVIIDEIQHIWIEDRVEKCVIKRFKGKPDFKYCYEFYRDLRPYSPEKYFPVLGEEFSRLLLDRYYYFYEFDINMFIAFLVAGAIAIIFLPFPEILIIGLSFLIVCLFLLYSAFDSYKYYLVALTNMVIGEENKPKRK